MMKPLLAALALACVTASALAERGTASWYGGGEKLARFTACGQVFNPYGLTAAHRTLRCGTKVKVVRLSNNKSVIVTINDRGPHVRTGRIIDLAKGAAQRLGFTSAGTTKVLVVPMK